MFLVFLVKKFGICFFLVIVLKIFGVWNDVVIFILNIDISVFIIIIFCNSWFLKIEVKIIGFFDVIIVIGLIYIEINIILKYIVVIIVIVSGIVFGRFFLGFFMLVELFVIFLKLVKV